MTIYQLTDRLHDGRTVRVQADDIAATVASWLAELGARSPISRVAQPAVRDGDWPAAHGYRHVGESRGAHDIGRVEAAVDRL